MYFTVSRRQLRRYFATGTSKTKPMNAGQATQARFDARGDVDLESTSARPGLASRPTLDGDVRFSIQRGFWSVSSATGARSSRKPTAPCSRHSTGLRPGSATSARDAAPCRRSWSGATRPARCCSCSRSRSKDTRLAAPADLAQRLRPMRLQRAAAGAGFRALAIRLTPRASCGCGVRHRRRAPRSSAPASRSHQL